MIDPTLPLHQLEEISKQLDVAECLSRPKNDKLGARSSKGYVETPPILEKVADGIRVIRPAHRDDDAVLVSTLGLISSKGLDATMRFDEMRKELDLLSVQRKDANLRLVDAASNKSFNQLQMELSVTLVKKEKGTDLSHQLRFHFILD